MAGVFTAIDQETATQAARSIFARGYAVLDIPSHAGHTISTVTSLRQNFALFGAFRDRKPNKAVIDKHSSKAASKYEDVTGFHVPADDTSRLNLVVRGGSGSALQNSRTQLQLAGASPAAGGGGTGAGNAAEQKVESLVAALDAVQHVSHGLARVILRSVADLLVDSDPLLVQTADSLPLVLEHPAALAPTAKLQSLTSTTAQFYDAKPSATEPPPSTHALRNATSSSGLAGRPRAGSASSSSSGDSAVTVSVAESLAVPVHIDCSLLTIIYLDGSDDRLQVFDQQLKQWVRPLPRSGASNHSAAAAGTAASASSSSSSAQSHAQQQQRVLILSGHLLAQSVNHLTAHAAATAAKLVSAQHRVHALPDDSGPLVVIVTRCMPGPDTELNLYKRALRDVDSESATSTGSQGCRSRAKGHGAEACSLQTMTKSMPASDAIMAFRMHSSSVNISGTASAAQAAAAAGCNHDDASPAASAGTVNGASSGCSANGSAWSTSASSAAVASPAQRSAAEALSGATAAEESAPVRAV